MIIEYLSQIEYPHTKGYFLLDNLNFFIVLKTGMFFFKSNSYNDYGQKKDGYLLNCSISDLDLKNFIKINKFDVEYYINVYNILTVDKHYVDNLMRNENNTYSLNIIFKNNQHLAAHFRDEDSENFFNQYRRFFNLQELIK